MEHHIVIIIDDETGAVSVTNTEGDLDLVSMIGFLEISKNMLLKEGEPSEEKSISNIKTKGHA